MAHHSKFLSVNLNKSYGKPPSPSTTGYGNGRPRSAGGVGGMVVLSRPRSSSGASAHKGASRLAVPPPVNLPSLRREHERLDPASSKPSLGHSGSGLGSGHGPSMGWTKPTLSSGEQRSVTGDARPKVFSEKAVILKGEDFPSLMAISASSSKQKQRQIGDNSDGWDERADQPSVLDMRPQLRSSALIKNSVHDSDGGSSRVPYSMGQPRQEDAYFQASLPLVRLRQTSDWDDDERDRNHGFSALNDNNGRDGEARSLLSWDSGRGDRNGREFMSSDKVDRDHRSWRATVQPNRDMPMSRMPRVDRDQAGLRNSTLSKGTSKESSHARLFNGNRREFGSVVDAEVAEVSNKRDEISNNWQNGKQFSSGMISKGSASSSGVRTYLSNDPVPNFSKGKLISNTGKSYVEDANWGGKGPLPSDAMLDLNAKVFKKKRDAMKPSDFFDPVRESFEAELERVQRLQELERQRMMEEQARAIEVARREAEDRERRVREEEERRRLLEEEAREAAWRVEQEKLEAARRAEEQKMAIKEEKKRILMEEERRKEAARQMLLDLEARIAKRQSEANTKDDSMKERDYSRDSDQAEWEKTGRVSETFTNSAMSDSSFLNRLPEVGLGGTHASNVEVYSFPRRARPDNKGNQNNSLAIRFQDQDGGYPSSRHDAFFVNRGFHRKQFQGSDDPKPVVSSFKNGMPADEAEKMPTWDKNSDCDQFNGGSNIDAVFGAWDHGHFNGGQLAPYSKRSFESTEVEDLVSFSRVRHTLRQPRVPPPPLFSSQHKNSFGATSEGPSSSLSVNTDVRSNSTGRKEESDLQIDYNCRYQHLMSEPGASELREGTSGPLLQAEDKISPIYDSQSSLSVSSPPSSPTQQSHDELDDCGGSPALTVSVEEENMTFSDRKHMMEELDARHMNSQITPFTHEDDDEWAVENDKEMKGDLDEVPDIYQEEDEVHESNTGNLQIANLVDDADVAVEKSDDGLKHSSYGINVCPQLADHDILRNEFGHGERARINQGSPSDSTTEILFSNDSGDSFNSKDTFNDEVLTSSLEVKTDDRQKDAIFDPVTTAGHLPDSIGASKKLDQNPIEATTSFSVPTSLNDVPDRLQFGLFSSPPLIPSPLPMIQIGSMQMPLPLEGQIDSFAQMSISHSPVFQFGQINRYAPPISQNALQIATPTTFSAYTSALGHRYINQNSGSSSCNLVNRGSTSINVSEKEQLSFLEDNQPSSASDIVNPRRENLNSEQLTAMGNVPRDRVLKSQSQMAFDEKKVTHNLFSHSSKNFRSMTNSRRMRVRPHAESLSSNRKSIVAAKAHGAMANIRGIRFTSNSRNAGSLPFMRSENWYAHSYQRQRRGSRHFRGTEYRVKENDGAEQVPYSENFNRRSPNEKPDHGNIAVGVSSRNLSRNDPFISKPTKLMDEAVPGSQAVGSDRNRINKKETMLKMSMTTFDNFSCGEGSLKTNGLVEDDIDAPLRSGIVRIFNQPGIEASADGDGFVEVRSKRKMSNERRGQREREISSKYKDVKLPRRHRSTVLNNIVASRSEKAVNLANGVAAKNAHSDSNTDMRRVQASRDASSLPIMDLEGQTLLPIGSTAMNYTELDANFDSLKPTQVGSDADKDSEGAKNIPSLSFGNNIIAHDKVSIPLGTWGTVHLNRQAITSTLSQVDEASNSFKTNTLPADKKPLFSSSNHLDHPFSGEKIQFGAVALPPTEPSSSQPVSSGIWPSGSVILNASIIHNVQMNANSHSSFFDKEKCSSEPCAGLDDKEAEAEAAASAVAVAAISNDEMPLSTLSVGSTSDNGTKELGVLGMSRFADSSDHSASHESLVVSLPADLSVDTPHSLWPRLPSIHSSHPMISHIAGPQPSPFPFFDPNSILGGPIFALRPQDESAGTQTQPQQNAAFGSMPTGTWSQCHSGVDSFYGSPAGFPAPFMSPSGGLSGVHGHPQMVFYSHFAPVGQFGQVGLSYMGTTYIPTGKQPDWKHGSEGGPPVSVNKADPGNLNVIYSQPKVAHVPTFGSAINSGTSPFPMFNLRPFQSSTETSITTQWPPISHRSPHSIRLSPAPEQLENLSLDANVGSNEPRSAGAGLPDEFALMDSSVSNSANGIHLSANSIVSMGESGGIGMVSGIGNQHMIPPQTISPVRRHHGPIGKADQPRAAPLKTSSGNEWRRRNAFPVKNRNAGTDKNIGSTKMKQIYVAKSLSTGHGTSG